MGNEYLVYLQEILDTSWVVELISEQFDDAINMMTTNSIIYGGAVRDCLAGKALLGDLDMAVSSTEYHILVSRFIKSPKWVLTNRTQKRTFPKKAEYKPFNPFLPVNNDHLYKNSKISGVTSFRTLGDKIVQIMELSVINDTPFQSTINFVKQVDIVCCGIMLTSNGKVFEVVPNAYNDCKKNMLCLNKKSNINNLEKLQSRIEKLVTRGWNNSIDMNQIVKKKRKHINKTNHKSIRFCYAENKSSTIRSDHKYRTYITNSEIILLGGKTKLLSLLDHFAKTYQIDIIIQSKFPDIDVIIQSKFPDTILMETVDDVTSQFIRRKIFGVQRKSTSFNIGVQRKSTSFNKGGGFLPTYGDSKW